MDERKKPVVQAATPITVIQSWVMLVHMGDVRRSDTIVLNYGPMLIQNREMMANLDYIYNYNDVEAPWMLRIKRSPLAKLVETFRNKGLLQDSTHTYVE